MSYIWNAKVKTENWRSPDFAIKEEKIFPFLWMSSAFYIPPNHKSREQGDTLPRRAFLKRPDLQSLTSPARCCQWVL